MFVIGHATQLLYLMYTVTRRAISRASTAGLMYIQPRSQAIAQLFVAYSTEKPGKALNFVRVWESLGTKQGLMMVEN